MKKIYVFGVFTGDSSYGLIKDAEPCGDVCGYAIDDVIVDNGKVKLSSITNHLSSGESWCKHDMGITSDWKHNIYNEMYPNGYELVWLGCFTNMDDAYETVVDLIL